MSSKGETHQRGVPLPNLAAWRDDRLLGRRELAERAGVTVATIGNIERGGVANWRTIDRLAAVLRITRESLIRSKPRQRDEDPAA